METWRRQRLSVGLKNPEDLGSVMEDYGLRLWTLKDVAKTSQDRLTCQYSTSAWSLDIARELQ